MVESSIASAHNSCTSTSARREGGKEELVGSSPMPSALSPPSSSSDSCAAPRTADPTRWNSIAVSAGLLVPGSSQLPVGWCPLSIEGRQLLQPTLSWPTQQEVRSRQLPAAASAASGGGNRIEPPLSSSRRPTLSAAARSARRACMAEDWRGGARRTVSGQSRLSRPEGGPPIAARSCRSWPSLTSIPGTARASSPPGQRRGCRSAATLKATDTRGPVPQLAGTQ